MLQVQGTICVFLILGWTVHLLVWLVKCCKTTVMIQGHTNKVTFYCQLLLLCSPPCSSDSLPHKCHRSATQIKRKLWVSTPPLLHCVIGNVFWKCWHNISHSTLRHPPSRHILNGLLLRLLVRCVALTTNLLSSLSLPISLKNPTTDNLFEWGDAFAPLFLFQPSAFVFEASAQSAWFNPT